MARKKKSSVKRAQKVARKPTAAQLRDVEFSNEVRHLSSDELSYRMDENARNAENAHLDIAELDARRKVRSAQLVRLMRDRAVLRAVLQLRSRDVEVN